MLHCYYGYMDHHDTSPHGMVVGESSLREYVKFAFVLAGIATAAFFLNGSTFNAEYMRWFMGVFFVVFASFKFIGYQMFAMMFAGYDVIAKKFKPYAYLYPFIELTLGVLYLLDRAPLMRDLSTLVLMSAGTIGVVEEIKKRSGIHCACLGNVIKLPLSTVSLVEDVTMGLMALVMIYVSLS